MNQFKDTIPVNDLLPDQDHYWVLHNGKRCAVHGGDLGRSGLLVFGNRERAEQFCLTIVKKAARHDRNMKKFKPKKISRDNFRRLVNERYGAFCVSSGGKIVVALAV